MAAIAIGVFGQCRRLAVVDDVDRQVVAGLEQIAQGQVVPVEVDGRVNDPALCVNYAGCAEADAQQGGVRLFDELVEQLVDMVEGFIPVGGREGQAGAAHRLPLQVVNAGLQDVAGQVHADEVTAVGLDMQLGRGLAATRRSQSQFGHQPLFHQLGYGAGNGGAGEACFASHVGAAGFGRLKNGAQDEPFVVPFGLVLGHFFVVAHLVICRWKMFVY